MGDFSLTKDVPPGSIYIDTNSVSRAGGVSSFWVRSADKEKTLESRAYISVKCGKGLTRFNKMIFINLKTGKSGSMELTPYLKSFQRMNKEHPGIRYICRSSNQLPLQ